MLESVSNNSCLIEKDGREKEERRESSGKERQRDPDTFDYGLSIRASSCLTPKKLPHTLYQYRTSWCLLIISFYSYHYSDRSSMNSLQR